MKKNLNSKILEFLKKDNINTKLTSLIVFCVLSAGFGGCRYQNQKSIEQKPDSLQKDGVVVENIKTDTIKIGFFQHTYVPLLRRYQLQNQKGN
ncbi:MAG: hypothetical protein IKZ49_00255 [Alphaproteobacteria bacterium]|nr:hypothetical protein [Alphaproteobacteria bacterium]